MEKEKEPIEKSKKVHNDNILVQVTYKNIVQQTFPQSGVQLPAPTRGEEEEEGSPP